jgi:hypothetical protein
MTEAEWLTADDPGEMLLYLRGKASRRKYRLFAVACCRRVSHPMLGARNRTAIEVAELHAEGAVAKEVLVDAHEAAEAEWDRSGTVDGIWRGPVGDNPVRWATTPEGYYSPCYHSSNAEEEAALGASDCAAGLNEEYSDELYKLERARQVPLLRDLMGNPFRPAAVDPGWLTPTVVQFAQAVYDDRAFERLPVLADALEEAGCDAPDILGHLRGPGPHVRGCWCVDLLTGRQ